MSIFLEVLPQPQISSHEKNSHGYFYLHFSFLKANFGFVF